MTPASSGRRWVMMAPCWVLAVLAGVFFAIRNVHGWTFLPFGDEAGHLLGALAMHHGDILYRDYIDAHGPVVFMLTQFYGALTGWHDLTYARLVESVLAVASGLCVVFSPVLRGGGAAPRLWAAALYFGLLGAVWILQALYMDNYYSIAGALVVMGVALFVAPAWIAREGRAGAFAAGVCFALAAFAGYSYAPAVAVLAASGLIPLAARWRGGGARVALALVGGGAAGCAVVLGWLAVFGDAVGYVVFHIVGNQVYYARYLWFAWANFVHSFYPPVGRATLVHLTGVACFGAAFLVFLAAVLRPSRAGIVAGCAVIVGFVGIALLNARGAAIFQDATFLMAAIGAVALALPYGFSRLGLTQGVAWHWAGSGAAGLIILATELTGRQAVATPSGYDRAQIVGVAPYHYGEAHNAMLDEIRRVVRPDERLLVLVYDPTVALSAGRLPMRKYHEYLPWEADYAKSPWFGRDRELCSDIRRDPPPLIYFDDWKVWGAYAPENFMPCLFPILASMYRREAQFPVLYVRNDRAGK